MGAKDITGGFVESNVVCKVEMVEKNEFPL